MKQYPCCDNADCPLCLGSGIAEGPDADALVDALERFGKDTLCFDVAQDACPKCRRGGYEGGPFGAAYLVRCTTCGQRWIEPG